MVFVYTTDVEGFYKRQYGIFHALGLSPTPTHLGFGRQVAYVAYFLHVILFWLTMLNVCCLLQIIQNISSLSEIIKVIFIFATAMSCMAKYICIKLRNHLLVEIIDEMHSGDFQPANKDEANILMAVLKWSRNNRNIYGSLSLTALTSVLGTQYIIDNTQLPLSIYTPMETEKRIPYICMYLLQIISVTICCLTNISFDSLAASMFIYIEGQLRILNLRLQNIGHTKKKDDFIFNQLRDCMMFYEKIIKLLHKIEDFVSVPMSIQILCSILVLIANFYVIAFLTEPGDYANYSKLFVYQLCMLTQIFILCFYASELSLESSKLSYSLYCSDWPEWNKVNRRFALIMMLNLSKPLSIKTINGCNSFNLAAFTSIVNSSYSYFALLRNMNK